MILPVYNEEERVFSAIKEIEKQNYQNKELLIVDDGSTDNTVNIASEAIKQFPDAHVVRSKHGGPSHARNVGIKESTGDVLFFGECDCLYDSEYVEKAINALRTNHSSGAVCLTGAPFILKHTLGTACLDVENKVQHRLLKEGALKPFYAWVYTKDALEKIGGFDENLFQAEDKDLFQRVVEGGYQVSLVAGINWWHKRDETIRQLATEWFRRGRTRILYIAKHGQKTELGKSLAPLYLCVGGLCLTFFSFYLGLTAVVLSISIPAIYSLRAVSLSWPLVSSKSVYLWYPLFALIRNFALAMGYSYGGLRMLLRKLQGKPISWQTV